MPEIDPNPGPTPTGFKDAVKKAKPRPSKPATPKQLSFIDSLMNDRIWIGDESAAQLVTKRHDGTLNDLATLPLGTRSFTKDNEHEELKQLPGTVAPGVLLVDVANTYARSSHAMADLRAPDGRLTGGIYGLFQTVKRALARFPEGMHVSVYFAYENKGSDVRKKKLPEYKEGREGKSYWQNEDAQVKDNFILHQLAMCMGYNAVSMLPAGEADDAIAAMARFFLALDSCQSVKILSQDRDLQRLLDPGAKVTVINSGGLEVTYDSFVSKNGYKPEEDLLIKALAGGDDDYKGIKGLGPKTAKQILEDAMGYWDLVLEHPRVAPHAAMVRNAVATLDFMDGQIMVGRSSESQSTMSQKRDEWLDALGIKRL